MIYGNKPVDGGNLLLTPNEKEELLKATTESKLRALQAQIQPHFLFQKKRYQNLIDCLHTKH